MRQNRTTLSRTVFNTECDKVGGVYDLSNGSFTVSYRTQHKNCQIYCDCWAAENKQKTNKKQIKKQTQRSRA